MAIEEYKKCFDKILLVILLKIPQILFLHFIPSSKNPYKYIELCLLLLRYWKKIYSLILNFNIRKNKNQKAFYQKLENG